ncbi:MAG: glycosyltransferase family 4 protein [Dehalococcoidia bacterium]|nr:glycosyltransferase family 4 protein [Dehalococcoidia bacterium]
MKIALVSPYDFTWPGGVTAHISQLGHQFSHMGHEVEILAPHSPARDSEPSLNFVPLGRSVPIPTGGSIARLSLSLWLHRKTKRILEEKEFDLVHLHEPLMPVLPLTVLQCSNTVNVGTFHAFYGRFRNYGWSHRLLKRWFNKLDGLIAVSPAAHQYVSRFFPGNYRIIPNGIDVDHFATAGKPIPELQDGKTNILFVGRLEKRKGLRYLLEAFGMLKWEHPNVRLLVVGPGSLDKDCHRVLGERNLQDVVFLGGVPYQDLPSYYASAHIFCSPATGRESFGIVLLEAMAAGRPIVATSIEGYSCVVTHGEQGLLVPPKDSASLAVALGRLVADGDLRSQMGLMGRQSVEQYRWEKIARMVMDHYENLMGAPNASVAGQRPL